MKRITLLCALLVMSTTSYAKIGRHNLQINIGGGYQVDVGGADIEVLNSTPGDTISGGLFTVELGYLLHSVRKNNTVHGLDIRANFTTAFLRDENYNFSFSEGGSVPKKFNHVSDKLSGGIVMAYTVGYQFKSGSRLMFDIAGVGVQYSTMNTKISVDDVVLGNNLKGQSVGIQYVFPGVQYIMNNGFTIGLKNKFNLVVQGGPNIAYFDVSTAVTLGFTYGSGKQPWETKES